MAAVTICNDFGASGNKAESAFLPNFPSSNPNYTHTHLYIELEDWKHIFSFEDIYRYRYRYRYRYTLECEVKWALGSITTNKTSGGNGIPAEVFQILKDNAVKVLCSICQQI